MSSSPAITLTVLLAVVAALLGVVTTTTAAADSGMESDFVAAINQERADRGLAPLSVSNELTSVARTHSVRMADADRLHHNPRLGSEVSGWQKVGENVGRGPSVAAIHAALMSSTNHRDNILGDDWTEIGVGVEVRDETVWVTQVFRLPPGASTSPTDDTTTDPGSDEPDAPQDDSDEQDTVSESATPTSTPNPTNGNEQTPSGDPHRHDVAERAVGMDRLLGTLMRLQASPLTALDPTGDDTDPERIGRILWEDTDPSAHVKGVRSGRAGR